jgi:hypothetical protein
MATKTKASVAKKPATSKGPGTRVKFIWASAPGVPPMKLYLITRVDTNEPYKILRGAIVRSRGENAARRSVAAEMDDPAVWLTPEGGSTCVELTAEDGPAAVFVLEQKNV